METERGIGSLWQASARVEAPATAPLEGEARADVVIVGAGFTGLSAALHAAEAGRSVIVLESHGIGHGASGRNGGQVNPGVKIDQVTLQRRYGEAGLGLHRAGQSAPDYLEQLVEQHKLRCGWRRPGLFRLAHNDAALATIRAAAASLRGEGVAVEDLDAGDVERRVGTRRYKGGFYDPRGGQVQPLELARELARAATAAGAVVHTGSAVTSLKRGGGGWQAETATGAVFAPTVVVATNAYGGDLVPGLERTILPVNSFQIATAPLDSRHAGILPGGETAYDSRRLVLYFRRGPDNRLLMGGRSSFSSSRATSREAPDYAVLTKVVEEAFPQLAGTPVEFRWTGLVGITLDYLPHYHAPEEGLHVLLGFNGRGVALSVRLGAWLGRKLAGAPEDLTIPQTPIRPFPLHRFREPVLNLGMRWNHMLDLFGR